MSAAFKDLFTQMISGDMPDEQIAQHLQALEDKGISETELAVGAQTLRDKMIPVNAPAGAIDIVGTGGDGLSTYNISTACSFVVAGAGVPVAKHGNRAVSSKSGASDVLQSLGIKLGIDARTTETCLQQAYIAFLFAPNHHKAMGNVAAARALLGTRTIFNRLGPLCNPAGVEHILVGVYADELRPLYAKALLALGTKRALVVHGGDGMDEITTTAPTMISELKDGKITEYEITPEQFGLKRASLKDLKGGDEVVNAQAILDLLQGHLGPYRDIVLLNSAAALYAAGKAESIEDGMDLARISIESGNAMAALELLARLSNG